MTSLSSWRKQAWNSSVRRTRKPESNNTKYVLLNITGLERFWLFVPFCFEPVLLECIWLLRAETFVDFKTRIIYYLVYNIKMIKVKDSGHFETMRSYLLVLCNRNKWEIRMQVSKDFLVLFIFNYFPAYIAWHFKPREMFFSMLSTASSYWVINDRSSVWRWLRS